MVGQILDPYYSRDPYNFIAIQNLLMVGVIAMI